MCKALRLAELASLPLVWFALVGGALSVHRFVWVDDHSLCGPWGCGPSSGALLAVHLAWFVAIGLPVLYLPWRMRWSPLLTRQLGGALAMLGILTVVGTVAWQGFFWLPDVSPTMRPFFLQRCGFVLATAIDWPAVELLGVGAILWSSAGRKTRSPTLV